MTLKEAQAICRDYGCTLTAFRTHKRGPVDHYRINERGGTEQTAVYTTTLEAAVTVCQANFTRKVIR